MEKLIELLNEYEKIRKSGWTYEGFDEYDGVFECKVVKTIFELDDSFVCSKKYMFIKWLVENEKINEEEYQFIGTDDMKYVYSDYEGLLMLLSIQDEPINFLISILK